MKQYTGLKFLFSSIAILIISINSLRAQTPGYAIPKGYVIATGADEKSMQVNADLDGDSIKDLFAIINSGETAKIISFMSSSFKTSGRPKIYEVGDFECCSYIELKNKVVIIHSNGNRYFSSYTLRYNSNYSDFEIIGYDDESFGNAVHDGSGSSSYNFLTGVFETQENHYDERKKILVEGAKKTRKIKAPKKYFLSNFRDAATFIESARPS